MADSSPEARYHERMLRLYATDEPQAPVVFDIHSLGMEHCSEWHEAVGSLPLDRDRLVGLANDVLAAKRAGEALALYRRMERLFPNDDLIAHNVGSLLKGAGERESAMAWFRRALELNPNRVASVVSLCDLLVDADPDGALRLLQDHQGDAELGFDIERLLLKNRLSVDPSLVDRLTVEELDVLSGGLFSRQASLLELLFDHGSQVVAPRYLECIGEGPEEWSRSLLRLDLLSRFVPREHREIGDLLGSLEANHGDVAEVLLYLSFQARRSRLYDKALEFAQRILRLDTDHVEGVNAAAESLFSLGRHRDAIEAQRHCLALDPLQARTHISLGMLHYAIGEAEASRPWMLRGMRLAPRAGDAWVAFANVLRLYGDLEGALEALSKAVEVNAGDHQTRTSLAFVRLQRGEYAEGWPDYEFRIHPQMVNVQPPDDLDRWDGVSALDDLVLVGEQGAGDLIQFLRYVPFLRLTIPRVSLLVDLRLKGLMELSGVFSSVFTYGEAVPVWGKAAWLPILSVPGLLGVSPDCVLIDQPYLAAPEAVGERWKGLLRGGMAKEERLVGLHWQGNPGTENTSLVGRSFPLEVLQPLASVPGIRFVSLQKGAGSEQLAACSFSHRFVAAQPEVDRCWDYVETTGMIAACDLVISSDSGVAHLAGALGVPTWLMLPFMPDWRWGIEGERSFWYPRMRLFRQPKPGDWASVVQRVMTSLARA